MTKITIDNEIYLKTPTIEDSEKSFNLLDKDREELMDIFNFVTKDSTLKDEQDFINSLGENNKKLFNIFYNDDLCGKIGIFSYDEDENSYEIYYYLGSDFRGKGIVTKAVKGFTDYIFNELNPDKIKFYINTDNTNSQKIADKLNLKFAGLFPKHDFCNGIYHDQNLYEMYNKNIGENKPTTR